jgi:hypothetical protein
MADQRHILVVSTGAIKRKIAQVCDLMHSTGR